MGSKIEGSGCVLVVWKWFVDPLLALPSIIECVNLLLGPSRRSVKKRYRGRLTILCNNMERCKSKLGWVRLIDSLWGFQIKWWHELMQKCLPVGVMQLCGLKKVRNVISRYLELISRLFRKIVGMSRLFSNNLSCHRDKNNLWPISEETSCVCSFNETLAFALTLKMIKAANPRAKATSLKTVTNVGQVLRVDLVKGNRKKRSFR